MPETRIKRLQISSILNDQVSGSSPDFRDRKTVLPDATVFQLTHPQTSRFDDPSLHILPPHNPSTMELSSPYHQGHQRNFMVYGNTPVYNAYNSPHQEGANLSLSACADMGQVSPISAFGSPSLAQMHMGTQGFMQPYSNYQSYVANPPRKTRRFRRRYYEINRLFKCSFQGCKKSYGSLNHLNTHIITKMHGPRKSKSEFKIPEVVFPNRTIKMKEETNWHKYHETDSTPASLHTIQHISLSNGTWTNVSRKELVPTSQQYGAIAGIDQTNILEGDPKENSRSKCGSRWSGLGTVLPSISRGYDSSMKLPSIPSIISEKV